jgi:hypothetical protein
LSSALDTLADKNLVTLGPDQFVYADDDDSYAISRLIRAIGYEEAYGVIAWYSGRCPVRMFLDGEGLRAALEGWLSSQSPEGSCAPAVEAKS